MSSCWRRDDVDHGGSGRWEMSYQDGVGTTHRRRFATWDEALEQAGRARRRGRWRTDFRVRRV